MPRRATSPLSLPAADLGWWIRSTTSVGAAAKRLIPNAMRRNRWHLEIQRNGAGCRGHITSGALGDATHHMSARRLSDHASSLDAGPISEAQHLAFGRGCRLGPTYVQRTFRSWAGGEYRGEGIGTSLGPDPRCSMRHGTGRRGNGAQAAGRASDFATRDSLKPRASATLTIVPSSGFPSPLNATIAKH